MNKQIIIFITVMMIFSCCTTQVEEIKSDEERQKEFDIARDEFAKHWEENIMITSPPLTDQELKITIDYNSKILAGEKQELLLDGEIICERKFGGHSYSALFNEDYPITEEFDYWESLSYTCVGDINLFGDPFYQNGEWWIFKEVQNFNNEGKCFHAIDIKKECPFDVDLSDGIMNGPYSLTMAIFHLASRYPVELIP